MRVRWTAENSGQVKTDSEIDGIQREADRARVADGEIEDVERAGLESKRKTMVMRDVGGASGFRRCLKDAASVGSARCAACRTGLLRQESAEYLLLAGWLDCVSGGAECQQWQDSDAGAAVKMPSKRNSQRDFGT